MTIAVTISLRETCTQSGFVHSRSLEDLGALAEQVDTLDPKSKRANSQDKSTTSKPSSDKPF